MWHARTQVPKVNLCSVCHWAVGQLWWKCTSGCILKIVISHDANGCCTITPKSCIRPPKIQSQWSQASPSCPMNSVTWSLRAYPPIWVAAGPHPISQICLQHLSHPILFSFSCCPNISQRPWLPVFFYCSFLDDVWQGTTPSLLLSLPSVRTPSPIKHVTFQGSKEISKKPQHHFIPWWIRCFTYKNGNIASPPGELNSRAGIVANALSLIFCPGPRTQKGLIGFYFCLMQINAWGAQGSMLAQCKLSQTESLNYSLYSYFVTWQKMILATVALEQNYPLRTIRKNAHDTERIFFKVISIGFDPQHWKCFREVSTSKTLSYRDLYVNHEVILAFLPLTLLKRL